MNTPDEQAAAQAAYDSAMAASNEHVRVTEADLHAAVEAGHTYVEQPRTVGDVAVSWSG